MAAKAQVTRKKRVPFTVFSYMAPFQTL